MTLGDVKTVVSQKMAGFTAYNIDASQDDITVKAEMNGRKGSVTWPISEFTPLGVEAAARAIVAHLKGKLA